MVTVADALFTKHSDLQALIECPECKHQVSDAASVCPSCSYPLKNTEAKSGSRKGESRFKTGAIVGLIGGVGMVAMLALGLSGVTVSDSQPADTGLGLSFSVDGPVAAAGMISCLVAAIVFAVALFGGSKMGRSARIAISFVALALSFVALIGLFGYFNFLALCFAPLFLWQPILELIGSVMMVSGSLKSHD